MNLHLNTKKSSNAICNDLLHFPETWIKWRVDKKQSTSTTYEEKGNIKHHSPKHPWGYSPADEYYVHVRVLENYSITNTAGVDFLDLPWVGI